MIKHVNAFKGDIEKLTTLMISSIYEDTLDLKKKVEVSLRKLCDEMLVQKNGDRYVFLTNEEQEAENAIRSIYIDPTDTVKYVAQVAFEEVIVMPNNKYRFSNRYQFSFNTKIDDRFYKNNSANGITWHLLTAYSGEEDDLALGIDFSGRKRMSQSKEIYICPICKKEHARNTFCPIVSSKFDKVKYDSESYLMGGIILECLERGADFLEILKEIAYCIEHVCEIDRRIDRYFNADFIINYFAAALECSPSKFYKKRSELGEKYLSLIKNVDVKDISSYVDEDGNIDDIDMRFEGIDDTFLDDTYFALYKPEIHLYKDFEGRKPTYYLRLEDVHIELAGENNQNIKKNQQPKMITYTNLSLGANNHFWGFDLFAEKEGKFKELFESKFDWLQIAEGNECKYSEAVEWLWNLEKATMNGFLFWTIKQKKNVTCFSTIYGQSEIEMHLVHSMPDDKNRRSTYGDGIYIYENEHRIFHYGSKRDVGYWPGEEPTEIVQDSHIRKLCLAIEKWNKKWERNELIKDKNKKVIKKGDVLAVTYSFVCSNKDHTIIPYCGIVKILTPEDEEIEEKVYLGYCISCDVYYIFRRDFDSLCSKGRLQCKVIDSFTKKVLWDSSFKFNDQSILSEMGYNVQASSNMSAKERQNILKKAIEEKKISENEIINLLELQIHLHSGDLRYRKAIEKWKEDSAFVKTYGLQSGRIKDISSIRTKS